MPVHTALQPQPGQQTLSVCWNQWSWAWFISCCDTWESRLIPRSLLRFVLGLGLVYCSLDAPFTTAEAATSLSGYLPLGNSSKTQTKINPNPEMPPAKPEFLRLSPFYVSIKERLCFQSSWLCSLNIWSRKSAFNLTFNTALLQSWLLISDSIFSSISHSRSYSFCCDWVRLELNYQSWEEH